jgi:hypothetical protein
MTFARASELADYLFLFEGAGDGPTGNQRGGQHSFLSPSFTDRGIDSLENGDGYGDGASDNFSSLILLACARECFEAFVINTLARMEP